MIKRSAVGALVIAALLLLCFGGWCQEQTSQPTKGEKQEQPAIQSNQPQSQPKVEQSTQTTKLTRRRRRIAVVDFEVPTEIIQTFIPAKKGKGEAEKEAMVIQIRTAANRLSTIVSDMLISALVKTGNFEVIERTQLQRLLEEHQMSKEGLLDPSTASKVGKVLGVDLILGGKLTEFGIKERRGSGLGILTGAIFGVGIDVRKSTARAVVDARLIDATTGRILMAEKGEGENKEEGLLFGGGSFTDFIGGVSFDSSEWTESRIGKAMRVAIEQIVQKILQVFPVEATVLFVLPDESVILDIGKFSGIKEGDQFELFRETELKDEQTGEVIWRERQKLGVVKVVEVQEDRCKCVPINALGLEEKPQKGDLAVLKKSEPVKKQESSKEKKK